MSCLGVIGTAKAIVSEVSDDTNQVCITSPHAYAPKQDSQWAIFLVAAKHFKEDGRKKKRFGVKFRPFSVIKDIT